MKVEAGKFWCIHSASGGVRWGVAIQGIVCCDVQVVSHLGVDGSGCVWAWVSGGLRVAGVVRAGSQELRWGDWMGVG